MSRATLRLAGRRAFLAVGSWGPGRGRHSTAPAGQAVRILSYGRFSTEDLREPGCVSAAGLRSHMAWLAESGRAVTVDGLLGFLSGSARLPHGAVLVSIDGASRSVFDVAAPILAEFGVPGGSLHPRQRAGEGSATLAEATISGEQVARLPDFGIEVGSQGLTGRRSLATMPADAAYQQLNRSRGVIAAETGRAPRCLAYPLGRSADVTLDVRVAAQAAGFDLAMTTVPGAVTPFSDPYLLSRIPIVGGERPRDLELLCAGGLDGLSVADSWASAWIRFQRKRRMGADGAAATA